VGVKIAPVTTLVVEDSRDFCQFLVFTLEQKTRCEIVGQASDGVDAVEQAARLQPDLILLDLGIPRLNGMEATRRIRKASPKSLILIVSQNSCIDIVQGALQAGAAGYLLKSDAVELPVAVNNVLRGVQFISSCLKLDSSFDHKAIQS